MFVPPLLKSIYQRFAADEEEVLLNPGKYIVFQNLATKITAQMLSYY